MKIFTRQLRTISSLYALAIIAQCEAVSHSNESFNANAPGRANVPIETWIQNASTFHESSRPMNNPPESRNAYPPGSNLHSTAISRLPDLNLVPEPEEETEVAANQSPSPERDYIDIASDSTDTNANIVAPAAQNRLRGCRDEVHYKAFRDGTEKFRVQKCKKTVENQRAQANEVGMELHEDYVYKPRVLCDEATFERRKRKAYNNKFRRKAREREAYLDMIKRFGDLQGQERFRKFKEYMERIQRLRSVNSMRRQCGYPDISDIDTYEKMRAEGITVCPSRFELAHAAPIPRLKRNSEPYRIREQLRTCNRARIMCGWKPIADEEEYKRMREQKVQAYPPTNLVMAAKCKLQLADEKLRELEQQPQSEAARRYEDKLMRTRFRTANHYRRLVAYPEIRTLEDFIRLRNQGAQLYPPSWLIRQAKARVRMESEPSTRQDSPQTVPEGQEGEAPRVSPSTSSSHAQQDGGEM